MRRRARPGTFWRSLLRWAAGRLGTPELVDDATDIFAEKARRLGPRRARRWYRRQALAALARTLLPARDRRRRARRAGWLAGVGLDAKLGARMLARYPRLTVVAGLAMSFAVFVGAGTFEVVHQVVDPTLPFPQADRLVGLRHWDRVANRPAGPLPGDFRLWQEDLSSVEEIGAFRTARLNLSLGDGPGEPVDVAVMSPSGFRITGVPPLLGRPLVEGDGEPGATPVAVVGYHLWRTRFGSDPAVVGRVVRLGEVRTHVVGVMPEGFGFPDAANLWTPLHPDDGAGAGEPLGGVFGRLAADATLGEAGAEVTRLGVPATADAPERAARLRSEVMPYWESAYPFRIDLAFRMAFYHLNVYPFLFLLLVSANVALLMFARAATRERELVVRSALGAGRARIVTQLFVEALVLGALATAVGLAVTGPALTRIYGKLQELAGPFPLPFWIRPRLSPSTMAYAGALTLLGATVAGVVPALKSTGRDVQARLRHATSGSGGPRPGRVWSAVIVTQVAATVLFTGVAWAVVRKAVQNAGAKAFFPAEEYLGVSVAMDREVGPPDADTTEEAFQRLYAARLGELERRIAADPAVTGVTLARGLPVKAHGTRVVEVDGGGATLLKPGRRGYDVYSDHVGVDFFDVVGSPVLAGRGFDAGDLEEGSRAVVVNASFVDEVLGGRSAVGRRIRYLGDDAAGEPGPWREIVGVVGDLVANQVVTQGLEVPPRSRIYHPLDPAAAGAYPLHLVIHVPGDVSEPAATLYAAAGAVSPSLRVDRIERLDRAEPELLLLWRLYAAIALMVSGIALFLSLAGIYAVMSFTVARRTREIGVRVALGASARRVVAEIFRRPVTQVGAGVAVGCMLMAAVT
ncbi:MAG TPA: ABC transporter permease, partial [Longimicrobiales bacterium]|nr:ABC transporter permease [Longimicrobiales bacterium]